MTPSINVSAVSLRNSLNVGSIEDFIEKLKAGDKYSESLRSSEVLELSDDDMEINFRAPLGEGGFCTVFPVKVEGIQGQFALKRLRLGIQNNPKVVQEALQDLNHEATILKALSSHENIIQLHGLRKRSNSGGDGDHESPLYQNVDPNFFLVLDMLKDTLDSMCEKWQKNRGFLTRALPRATVTSRLSDVAMGIAKGMAYIHSKNIIFRDLKPSNIGFDHKNGVKILDFGLALQYQPEMGPSPFKGRAGTLRYMAPEVANNREYGLSADVYSFAILLWQICTSRLPYEEELGMFDHSLPKNKLPSLRYVESNDLRRLLSTGWVADPMKRPTFEDICFDLRTIILHDFEKLSTRKTQKSGKFLRKTSRLLSLHQKQLLWRFALARNRSQCSF